jgi:hypothetical protein
MPKKLSGRVALLIEHVQDYVELAIQQVAEKPVVFLLVNRGIEN